MSESIFRYMKTFKKEVECQICGFKHPKTLQGHIKKEHKHLSIKEYKEKYQAEIVTEELKESRRKSSSFSRGPMSEEDRIRRSLSSKKFWDENKEKRKEVSDRMKQLAEKGEHNFQRDDVKNRNKKRISKLNKSEEHVEIVKKALTGKILPRDQVEKSAEGHRGYKHSEEAKLKMSESQKKSFLSGDRKEPGKYLGKIWSSKNNKYIHYRSELELLYIHELEKNNEVKEYKPGFSMPYELDGETHVYFPDFVINNNIIVEINSKNVFYLNRKKKEIKVKTARKFCEENGYKYKILYEDYFGIEYNIMDETLNYNFPTE